MSDLTLRPASTALILIDLQTVIVGREPAPYTGAQVVANGRRLAEGLRAAGGVVIYVRVDLGALAQLNVDAPSRPPGTPPPPPSAMELVPEAGFRPGDLLVTKKQWGAFYGTDLDQQLRRRQIATILLGGVATNFGVESTARAAAERAYEQIFVEDAMSSVSADAHALAIKLVFPRLGRVRSTETVLEALARAQRVSSLATQDL